MSVTNLHTRAEDYPTQLFNVIAQLEGQKPAAYFDTKGIITIGVGFNIEGANRSTVMAAMGLTAAQQTAINTAWSSPNMATIRAMLPGAAKDAALQAYLDGVLAPARGFTMSDTEMRSAFTTIVAPHETAVNDLIATPSLERIALVSMHYNVPELIGPGLRAAIALADPFEARAEAWYQIRYSHANELHKRRFVEAAVFGLYDSSTPTTNLEQSQAIYRMYTRHGRTQTPSGVDMVKYETTFRSQRNEAQSEVSAPTSLIAGLGLTVSELKVELQPAADTLIAEYITGAGIPSAAAYGSLNIQVAFDGTVVIGEDTVTRTAKNADLLIGRANESDTLRGLSGDDVLVGLSGDDNLQGGVGIDYYVFKANEGDDTIIDSDGLGEIKVAGVKLTGAGVDQYQRVNDKATWTDAATGVTYSYHDHGESKVDLTIEGGSLGSGSILIKDFDLNLAGGDGNVLGVSLKAPALSALVRSGERSPFAHTGVTSAPDISAQLSEMGAVGLTFCSTIAAAPGDTLTIKVKSGDASKIKVCTGADTFALDTPLTLALTPGQSTKPLIFLNGSEIAGDANVQIEATFTHNGKAIVSNLATLNIKDMGAGAWNYTSHADGDWISFANWDGASSLTIDGLPYSGLNLAGAGGSDILFGYSTADRLDGGEGNDVIFGGLGSDQIQGGAGNDLIMANLNADRAPNASWASNPGAYPTASEWISGASYNYFGAGASDPHIVPGLQDNWAIKRDPDGRLIFIDFVAAHLALSDFSSTISALDVEDPSQGDTVDAGAGDDYVWGGLGADTLLGGADNDRLYGLGGADVMEGGGDDDKIYGDANPTPAYMNMRQNGKNYVTDVHPYHVVDPLVHGNDVIDGGAGNAEFDGKRGTSGEYRTRIECQTWPNYPLLHTQDGMMTTTNPQQDSFTQPCRRTRRASVPQRLRARGRGFFFASLHSRQHLGLHAGSVATANWLRRSGTATRHVCGLGWVGEVRYRTGEVHSMRVVGTKWLGRCMNTGILTSHFVTQQVRKVSIPPVKSVVSGGVL